MESGKHVQKGKNTLSTHGHLISPGRRVRAYSAHIGFERVRAGSIREVET
jgi:hypothetical protein